MVRDHALLLATETVHQAALGRRDQELPRAALPALPIPALEAAARPTARAPPSPERLRPRMPNQERPSWDEPDVAFTSVRWSWDHAGSYGSRADGGATCSADLAARHVIGSFRITAVQPDLSRTKAPSPTATFGVDAIGTRT